MARLLLVAVVLGFTLSGCFMLTTAVQCDGSVPTWMIEAQDYDGSGCAEVLPSWQAPPDADWTPYCLGYCLEEP